jgi:hypothetical protein
MHFGGARSVSAFAQESGRAGRSAATGCVTCNIVVRENVGALVDCPTMMSFGLGTADFARDKCWHQIPCNLLLDNIPALSTVILNPFVCCRKSNCMEDNQRVTYTYTVSADVIRLLSV